MIVGRVDDLAARIGRQHPWTYSEKNPEWRYHDFKSQPELIPQVLEDFKELEHEEAIQRFYLFLAWLNGPDSCLESNDSGLRRLQDNTEIQFAKKRRILGRVMVFFRREDLNEYDQNSNWLLARFHFHLFNTKPNFVWGAVELARFPTFFVRRSKEGYILQMQFFSYGDNDDEVLANLDELLEGISTAASEVNREVREYGLCPISADPVAPTP